MRQKTNYCGNNKDNNHNNNKRQKNYEPIRLNVTAFGWKFISDKTIERA